MGGKGQRRREKNYKAAHGGFSRLPPPPKPTDIDALPSKLRRLMDFTASKGGSLQVPMEMTESKKRKRPTPNPKGESDSKTEGRKAGGTDEKLITPKHESAHEDAHDKKKAKRKRKQVADLRFDTLTQDRGAGSLKRKERKKKYLEAKKKKQKKGKTEEGVDFAGHESIKFGEVVKAPPKLSAMPKGLKTVQDVSHERLRLQAVEAYRKRKGWVSRLGVQLPSVTTSSF